MNRYIKTRKIFESKEIVEDMFQDILDDFDAVIADSKSYANGLFYEYLITFDNLNLYNYDTIKFVRDRFNTDGNYSIDIIDENGKELTQDIIRDYDTGIFVILIVNKTKLAKMKPVIVGKLGDSADDINWDVPEIIFKNLGGMFMQFKWKGKDGSEASIINLNELADKKKNFPSPYANEARHIEFQFSGYEDVTRTFSAKTAFFNLVDFILQH